ncbi:MAG TPA: group II intron reverse transcriptase/maturase [Pyrinomonadaceae bacterium]|nr:group II intron reverse transcriptase/maturase [Pyrinomonadaceae bacterium]
MARDLTRIGERARKEPEARFTSIYHYGTDLDHLRACYADLPADRAVGIDGVGKEEYGVKLEQQLADLSARLGRLGYRPQPVRRTYIRKPGTNKQRPLGILCFEDKLAQLALGRVMEQIYEADFIEGSYGYRPGRTQHQALDELGRTIQQRRVSYIVEADIKGFFDHVNQEWLMKFLQHRIGDERVLRLIVRMLKGGIMEDGLVRASDEGVPQGGNLSPLLSNVYLHYALDLWFERRFKRTCRGEAYYFRYADDFLACFQYREDAERFRREMEARLAQFHLEIEPSKTKLFEFGRFAEENARRRGQKPETFDFLGFTHYCGHTKKGGFKVKRKTSAKKYRYKLKEVKEWLQRERSRLKKGELLRRAKLKLAGHLNYYAITDNWQMCSSFRTQFTRLVYKWLNRQSQKRSYDWERFNDALAWVGWPSVRIMHQLEPCRRVSALKGS